MDSFAKKILSSGLYPLLDQHSSEQPISNLFTPELRQKASLSRASFYLYAKTYPIRSIIKNNRELTKSQVVFLLKQYDKFKGYSEQPFENIRLYENKKFDHDGIIDQLTQQFNSNIFLLGEYFKLTSNNIYPVAIHQGKESIASSLLFLSWWSIWLPERPCYADIPIEVKFLFREVTDGDKSSFMYSLMKILRKSSQLQAIHRCIAMQSSELLLMRFHNDPCSKILIKLLENKRT